MNIQDELKREYDEYLQERWDTALVEAFFSNLAYVKIGVLCAKFIDDNKIAPEKLWGLKRTPKGSKHNSVSVRRFIAAYLPVLNTHLWDGKRSKEVIARMLNKSDLDTRDQFDMSDVNKVIEESKERRDDTQKYRAAYHGIMIGVDRRNISQQGIRVRRKK